MLGVIQVNKMTEIKNTISKWESLIGSFLLSFGRIEWFTYYLLTRLPSEDIFNSVSPLGLQRRIELIQQLIVARNIPSDTIDSIKKFFQKTKELSKIRNTIAHNPLHLNIYNLQDEFTRRYQIARYGKLESPITLEELEAHCKAVEELSDECIKFVDIIDEVIFKQNRITKGCR